MTRIHDRHARGHTRTGWLDSRHTFSFGQFMDQSRMGFGPLRVINDDRVIPGAGFPTHGHRDMEILTYVLSGALAHKDSLGNGSIIRPGEIQRMSAGTGITHSEMNGSEADPVHFLQIWIEPERQGIAPSYEQVEISNEMDNWTLIAGPDSAKGAVKLHQDVKLYAAKPSAGSIVKLNDDSSRKSFVHVIDGELEVGSDILRPGDALEAQAGFEAGLKAKADSHLLYFDVAA